MTEDTNRISYGCLTLCMVVLLVIQVHIIERINAAEELIAAQNTVIVEQQNTIAQLERDVRYVQQDVECVTNIIVRGDYTND